MVYGGGFGRETARQTRPGGLSVGGAIVTHPTPGLPGHRGLGGGGGGGGTRRHEVRGSADHQSRREAGARGFDREGPDAA